MLPLSTNATLKPPIIDCVLSMTRVGCAASVRWFITIAVSSSLDTALVPLQIGRHSSCAPKSTTSPDGRTTSCFGRSKLTTGTSAGTAGSTWTEPGLPPAGRRPD